MVDDDDALIRAAPPPAITPANQPAGWRDFHPACVTL